MLPIDIKTQLTITDTLRIYCCDYLCRYNHKTKNAIAMCEDKCQEARVQKEVRICSSACAFSDTTKKGGCKKDCTLTFCQEKCLLDSNQTACEDYCDETGFTPSTNPCSSLGLPNCELACLNQGLTPCASECKCLAPGPKQDRCAARCVINSADCGDLLTAVEQDVNASEMEGNDKHRFNLETISRAIECVKRDKSYRNMTRTVKTFVRNNDFGAYSNHLENQVDTLEDYDEG